MQPRLRAQWPALTAGVLALLLYMRTLAPGLTWAHHSADGGDLLAAAATAGVPHPPGYPTYQLLLRAALWVLPLEPALVGNGLSALCTAIAAGLLAQLAYDALRARPWRGPIALSVAVTWATAPIVWSQALVTEVYATHALVCSLLFWLLWRWRAACLTGRCADCWLAAAGLTFGLGLGVHLSLALMLPAAGVWLWHVRKAVGHAGAATRRWWTPLLTVLLGLAVFVYLPLAAAADPSINWGNPATVTGFWWLVSAEAYRGLIFGLPLADVPARLAAWAAAASRQLGGGPWGALLALFGLWRLESLDRAWWRFTVLVALAYSAYAIGYNTADSYVYLIPTWTVAALWLAVGLDQLAAQLLGADAQAAAGTGADENLTPAPSPARRGAVAGPPSLRGKGTGELDAILKAVATADEAAPPRLRRYVAAVSLAGLLLALPVFAVARHWNAMDLSHDSAARDFIAQAAATAAPNALILSRGDAPTFALWYARYGLGWRPDLVLINVSLYDYPWYRATLLRHHPSLASFAADGDLPPWPQFVRLAGQRWPLYRTDPLGAEVGTFAERPEGVLVRLLMP